MKTFIPQRAIGWSALGPDDRPNPSTREHLPLRSLPDCLLAAYDEVLHRAFERFVARGSRPGNEIADWRAAEKDLFLPVDVDFEDTRDTLYALATVAQCYGTQIEVAIEDRWLLVWAHLDSEHGCEQGVRRSADQESRRLNMNWIEWEELHSILLGSEPFGDPLREAIENQQWDVARPVTARPFCVVELPAEIDISRSSVVLSDGLIAIRMPKLKTATLKPVGQRN
jgi:Protein of unknown function (DUF2934)